MNDDDTALAERVRELLRAGRLPGCSPDRVWGGFGSGREECVACGELLAQSQVVMEAEFGGADAPSSLSFHRDCFLILESEWRSVGLAPESTVDGNVQPRRKARAR